MTEDLEQTEPKPLKDPNQNPWYCLATLYGEEVESHVNKHLSDQNRTAWNRWVSTKLSDDERNILLKKNFPSLELKPMNENEKRDLLRKFRKRINLKSAKLPDLDDPIVLEPINFENLTFKNSVDFSGFIFPHWVSFLNSIFELNAHFDDAQFYGSADFKNINFLCGSSFSNANFLDRADFENCIFHDLADFEGVNFTNDIFFNNSKFNSSANFSFSKFYYNISFQSSILQGRIILFETCFYRYVPDFRDAILPEAIEFHDVKWPKIWVDTKENSSNIYRYQNLKCVMEKQKRHQEELMFLALELRARRPEEKSLLNWLANWLYDITSSYGQSIGRPVVWLVGTFSLGFAVALINDRDYFEASAFSAGSMFAFLPIKINFTIANLSSLEVGVSIIQTILSLLFLFLIGLALRNRFRMK